MGAGIYFLYLRHDGSVLGNQVLLPLPQLCQRSLAAPLLVFHLLYGKTSSLAVLLPRNVLHLQSRYRFCRRAQFRCQRFVCRNSLGSQLCQPIYLLGQLNDQLAAGNLLPAKLLHAGSQFIIFAQCLLIQTLRFLHIGGKSFHQRFGGDQILSRRLFLGFYAVHRCLNGISLPAQLGQLGFQLLRLPAVFLCLGSQCIDLSPTGKNGSVFIHRAAGQAAAGINHLTVQRYRAVAVAVRLGNGGRRINILGHNGAAQQRSDHLAVTIIALHQFTGKTHIAAPRRHVVLFYRVGTDIGQRQKGRPSGAFFFQVHNGTLCRTLVLHHNVLDRCAQCNLHGSGIPVLGLNQAGDRTDNSPQGACARLRP